MVCYPQHEFLDGTEVRDPIDISNKEGGRTLLSRIESKHFSHSRFETAVGHGLDEKISSLRGNLTNRVLQAVVTLDVMVVWTKYSECRRANRKRDCVTDTKSTRIMQGLIDLAISETNTAFALSGIFAEVRLVHAYRHPTYREPLVEEFSSTLKALSVEDDLVLDDVHLFRDLYGADVVSMVIDSDNSCELGMLGPSLSSMLSISSWKCATGYYSFGHGIGHNLGCKYDRGVTDECSSSYQGYGYRHPQAKFRSIMSTDCVSRQCEGNKGGGCPRVQRFSNPFIPYEGSRIGSAYHDNASIINNARFVVANYFGVNS